MDLSSCPCSGRTLTRLVQPAVLAILRGEPLHGYLILRRLSRMPMFRDMPPDAAGVYRMLRSMEATGLLRGKWDLADRGPARRRFELTADGRRCLELWRRTLVAYERAVANLLAALRGAGRGRAGSCRRNARKEAAS